MGAAQESNLLYRAIFETGNVRYRRWPANANAIQVTGDRLNLGQFTAYQEIVAAGALPARCWLYGATYAGVLNLTTSVEMLFDVGVGAGGAEISLSVGTGLWAARRVNIGAAPQGIIVRDTVTIPVPILLSGSPRLAVRGAQLIDAANNHSWSIALHTFEAMGT